MIVYHKDHKHSILLKYQRIIRLCVRVSVYAFLACLPWDVRTGSRRRSCTVCHSVYIDCGNVTCQLALVCHSVYIDCVTCQLAFVCHEV